MILIARKSTYLFLFLLMIFQLNSCAQRTKSTLKKVEKKTTFLKTGAQRTNLYLNILKGRSIAFV